MGVRYRWRILRNLLILAGIAFLMWWAADYPLPTLEMKLHRWERQTLQEESEIVWTYDWGLEGDSDMMVGVSGTSVTTAMGYGSCVSWLRNRERATLITLPWWTRYIYEDVSLFATSFLAVDPPAGAERARLTMEISQEDPDYRETYEMEGERQGDVFLFQLKLRHYYYWTGQPDLEEGDPGWEERQEALALEGAEDNALSFLTSRCRNRQGLDSYPWHLEFFDGAGNLLEEQFSEAFNHPAIDNPGIVGYAKFVANY